jgi:putative nucleotidyltransferase with HDIG domain
LLTHDAATRAPDRAVEGAPHEPGRYTAQMLLATTVVAVLPFTVSLALRAYGVISSAWLSVALAIVLSLGASAAGSAYWRKHGAGGEVLFSELLLWGWIRRRHQERDLTDATELLGLVGLSHDEAVSVERREQLLRQLANALEGQDVYLNGHSRRVARHAAMIARGMGLPKAEVARIRAAAAVHDVGKLRTPKAILNKPGRLSDAEFEVIKRHPVDGAEMVEALGDPELTRIIRHHHERLDGAGYPDGLAGDRIPVGARIIAVADTFDAITSARPYRAAATHQKAIDILRREAGTQLDPDAVRSFLAYYSGNRPTAVWAIVTSSLHRLVAWLSGDSAAAATISAGKIAAATAATAAIGVAAGTVPVHLVRPSRTAATVASRHVSKPRGAVVLAFTRWTGSVTPTTTHLVLGPSHAVRSHGAHVGDRRTAAPSHRAHRVRSDRARASATTVAGPGTDASTPAAAVSSPTAGTRSTPAPAPVTASQPSATNPTGAPTSTAAVPTPVATVPTSTGSGRASRPTSIKPAGHVNHGSSAGSGARNGQLPGWTPPRHSGPDLGNGDSTPATTPVPAIPPATPAPVAPSVPIVGQTTGHGQGQGNHRDTGNDDGNATANGNGNANGDGNGNATANGNGNGNGPRVWPVSSR